FCYHTGHEPHDDGGGGCGTCPTAPTCQTATCDNGVCGVANVAGGTEPPELQIDGDCKKVVCDGEGNANQLPSPQDLPPDSDCLAGGCSGTTVVRSPKPAGTPCGSGGFCNKAGQCAACAPGATECG